MKPATVDAVVRKRTQKTRAALLVTSMILLPELSRPLRRLSLHVRTPCSVHRTTSLCEDPPINSPGHGPSTKGGWPGKGW
jgi:hypothetical protein